MDCGYEVPGERFAYDIHIRRMEQTMDGDTLSQCGTTRKPSAINSPLRWMTA